MLDPVVKESLFEQRLRVALAEEVSLEANRDEHIHASASALATTDHLKTHRPPGANKPTQA